MSRLEDFVESLRHEMGQAQAANSQAWPGTIVAGMALVLAARVERVDASGTLGLRIGGASRKHDVVHELRIDIPGDGVEAITVHLDGRLLGHYGNSQPWRSAQNTRCC